jgi:hypothetical protein
MVRMAKDPAAVSLGRRGGKARVRKQTPQQRTESARNAAIARWAKTPTSIRTRGKASDEPTLFPTGNVGNANGRRKRGAA